MNIFCFTGNLGSDCKVEYTAGGTAVCSFNTAVKSGYGDHEKTTWVRCQLFGKKAEGSLPDYLLKGRQVAVTGELTLDEWQTNDGTQKMLKVRVSTIDLIGGKSDQNTSVASPAAQGRPAQAPPSQPAGTASGGGYDASRRGQPQHEYTAGHRTNPPSNRQQQNTPPDDWDDD